MVSGTGGTRRKAQFRGTALKWRRLEDKTKLDASDGWTGARRGSWKGKFSLLEWALADEHRPRALLPKFCVNPLVLQLCWVQMPPLALHSCFVLCSGSSRLQHKDVPAKEAVVLSAI